MQPGGGRTFSVKQYVLLPMALTVGAKEYAEIVFWQLQKGKFGYKPDCCALTALRHRKDENVESASSRRQKGRNEVDSQSAICKQPKALS